MKNRLLYFLKYYLFWYLYFVILKILFLSFHFSKTITLNLGEIWGVFYHGFKLDLSMASYIAMACLLFLLIFSYFKREIFTRAMRILSLLILIVFSLIAVGDLELYTYWGYRLDTTPLMYIDTPGEMAASVEWYIIVRQLAIAAVLIYALYRFYKKWCEKEIENFKTFKIWQPFIILFLMACLIIPIRGGLKLAPLNTGTAYFSEKIFANHAANNVIWNLAFSFTYYGESTKNPFVFTDMEKAKSVRDEMITTKNNETEFILKTKRPNILLIILESFNNKIISELGGMAHVTPNLNRYCKEGICFTNFYSNGDRSDKGLVAIHSGFPAQAIASIIKFPYKTETLPFFTKDLKKAGYQCSYYYGGDINFAAMRSYINNAGYDKIVTDTDFPKSTYGAKWGVHDEYVFERFLQDIPKAQKPFLHTLFTLSSHEPFDVPFKSEFNGNSQEQKFLNAAKYTDSCLGIFIEKLRKLPEWDSTLVIITADHGSNHPNNTDYYECIRYHIPMVWLGGAIKQNTLKITHIGAQSDIPVTLLDQLGIKPEKKFVYGKDLFNKNSKSFAYYSFNNGFGLVTDTAKIVFNNSSKTNLYKEGNTDSLLYMGKCVQQVVYDEFLKR